MKRIILLCSVLLVCLGVGLYRLTDIPGEWYGDISIVHEYVQRILSGAWPFRYSESAGPLYHYLIAPGILVSGHSYLAYKISSVFVGMASLVGVFLLSGSLLVTFLTGTSFWFLAWERTGNSQILIVALTSFTVYFARRLPRLGFILSLLGLFVYPQTWVLPIVFLLLSPRRDWMWRLVVTMIAVFGIYLIFQHSGHVGYIESKIWPIDLFRLPENIWRTLLMLHVRGDGVFRVNVSGNPQLDVISGILFLIGVAWWMKKKQFIFIWLPIVILILPSIFPTIPISEIPNSGRTIAILPFVMILVASGLRVTGKYVAPFLLLLILFLNLQKYFIQYPEGLPAHNRPTARMIAEYIDTILKDTPVYLSSCCWEEWGQPEPKAIYYQLKHPEGRESLLSLQFPPYQDGSIVIGRPKNAGELFSSVIISSAR